MGKHAGKGGPGFVIADVLIHRSKSGGGCIGFYEAHVSASRGPRP
ncbi:hypothetical protein ABIF65_003345 [Bradyrhizobium japonicum]|nr:hypothetical protein [Bradyrhizobium japonicum]MCP1766281.1 hypothetical protein [Bradyrhizobium japonicum]MCP1779870.1 hypothetical protein [Bradyrhizobium japonicum]MCP1788419.1 hypothetical protein [Bradyrhizobium japonicum]MCP1810294.1 hypothetical protein [Bradyrhizobium japonicum]